MKVAIISDIHDNLANLDKCLKWCVREGVSEIICCGDVTTAETVKHLSDNFQGKIHLVRGNMEIYRERELQEFSNLHYYGDSGCFGVDGRRVGACHEPYKIEQVKQQSECDVIFYGHTHKPWSNAGDEHELPLINPGTLGAVFQKATFAVWEPADGGLDLVQVEELPD